MTCSLIALESRAALVDLCRASSLNPHNDARVARSLFAVPATAAARAWGPEGGREGRGEARAGDARPMLLAFQVGFGV
jgi:hypothetical protein